MSNPAPQANAAPGLSAGLNAQGTELEFRNLLEKLPVGAYTCDREGLITYFNHQAVQLWGRAPALNDSRDRFCGSFRLFSAAGDPIDHDQCWMALAIRTNQSFNGQEIIVERPDGQRLIVLAHANPIHDASGRLTGAVNVLMDITASKGAEADLRESEGRFRQLVENLQDIFWMSNVEGTQILYVSPAYEAVSGRSCQSLYDNPYQWLEAVHPEDLHHLRDIHQRVLHDGVLELEYRIQRADGMLRWVRSRTFPVCNQAGEVYRLAGFIEDITARREAEALRQQQQAELIHMARLSLAGEMASGMAHEINQPLTAINSYVDVCSTLLEREPLAIDRLKDIKKRISLQTQRAGAIVHRMKNFTRRTPARPSPVDLNTLIDEAVQLVHYGLVQEGIVLKREQDQHLPEVWADGIQIQQVLANLLGNAQEALRESPACQGEIRIATRLTGNGQVEVTVRDNGPGLSEDVQAMLFEPFFTTKVQGTGLGLAISRSIVKAHGGRLWATANPQGGATFHFTLPTARRED